MEYEGMTLDVVASGINGGTAGSSNGSATSGSMTATGAGAAGTGAGAAGVLLFLVFFFCFLPLMPMAAPPPPAQQQQNKARIRSHCQTCSSEPQEPDAVEELADPDESLALDPVLKEPSGPEPDDFHEAED